MVVVAPIAFGAYRTDALPALGISLAIWLIAIGSSVRAYGVRRPSWLLTSALVIGILLGLTFALVGILVVFIVPVLVASITTMVPTSTLTENLRWVGSLVDTAITGVGVVLLLAFAVLAIRERNPVRAVKRIVSVSDNLTNRFLEWLGTRQAYIVLLPIALVVLLVLGKPPSLTLNWSLFQYLWAYGVIVAVGFSLSTILLKSIASSFDALAGVWMYLKVMGQTMIGYALLYCLIVVWFAACFTTFYTADHRSFTPPADDRSFWDFLYFAVMTFPPLGYSDVHPNSPWTKVLTSTESILGVVMTVVVFVAITAYLSPRFKEIDEQRKAARANAEGQ